MSLCEKIQAFISVGRIQQEPAHNPVVISIGHCTVIGARGAIAPPPPIFLTRGLRPLNISEDEAKNDLEFARGFEIYPLSFHLTNQAPPIVKHLPPPLIEIVLKLTEKNCAKLYLLTSSILLPLPKKHNQQCYRPFTSVYLQNDFSLLYDFVDSHYNLNDENKHFENLTRELSSYHSGNEHAHNDCDP